MIVARPWIDRKIFDKSLVKDLPPEKFENSQFHYITQNYKVYSLLSQNMVYLGHENGFMTHLTILGSIFGQK